MLRETILQLSKAAEARKPALLVKIASLVDSTRTSPNPFPDSSSNKSSPGYGSLFEEPKPVFAPRPRPFDSVDPSRQSAIDPEILLAKPKDIAKHVLPTTVGDWAPKSQGSYLSSMGYGAGAGAIAGIPIALLARALFSKDEEDADLSSYLMTALKGALIGGGVGALGGAGLRGAYGTEGGKNVIDKGLGYLPSSVSTRVQGALD